MPKIQHCVTISTFPNSQLYIYITPPCSSDTENTWQRNSIFKAGRTFAPEGVEQPQPCAFAIPGSLLSDAALAAVSGLGIASRC